MGLCLTGKERISNKSMLQTVGMQVEHGCGRAEVMTAWSCGGAENRFSENCNLLQAVDGAAAQLGVRLLGIGEALRHGLEVGGFGRVRPATVEPDLREGGVLCCIND